MSITCPFNGTIQVKCPVCREGSSVVTRSAYLFLTVYDHEMIISNMRVSSFPLPASNTFRTGKQNLLKISARLPDSHREVGYLIAHPL